MATTESAEFEPEARKSWLDRALNLISDVRAGEAATAVLLCFNVFILLGAYYIIKPVREALILSDKSGGAEIKSYTGGVQAALFMFIVPAYSAFAARVNRIKLTNALFAFFISNLLIFYFLSRSHVPLGIAFFLWVGIFNVMMIAQFWSFANDVYTPEQGKRLFAIVGIGSTVGAVAGSEAAALLVKPIGVYAMMLVSAGLLVLSALISNVVHVREKNRIKDVQKQKVIESPLGPDGGFQLIKRHRYLLLIALLTLMENWVNSNGEYILSKTVGKMAHDTVASGQSPGLTEAQVIGSFYAHFQFWQNLIGALIQFFLVSRILKYFGVRTALFILPLISFSAYSVLATIPLLTYVGIAKIAENSVDYSLQNTVRHALFLPTSREAKYKAKQAVDTFFWRSGDLFSALTVFVGAKLLGLAVKNFAAVNILFVLIWIAIAAGIGRENRKFTSEPATAAAD